MSSPEIPAFLLIDSASQAHRKTKRLIPDSEKDAKYWAKRYKNNEAAKRSREHKRQLDSLIRNRVRNLEEENALLRRELSLLKVKFNISESQSLLSREDKDKCTELAIEKEHLLKEANKCDQNDLLTITTIKSETPIKSEYSVNDTGSQFPLLLLAGLSSVTPSLECDEQSKAFNDDRLFHYSQKDLGTPPKAHSPGDEFRKYESVCPDDESVPADLTVNRRKRKYDGHDLRILSRLNRDRSIDNCEISSEVESKYQKGTIKTEAVLDTDQITQEIKEKLQSLSDQVLIMQKTVNC